MFVMKTSHPLLLILIAAAAPFLQASESKRTADYILATPADFQGKEVTLDVSFVKPVHWKSPVPELAFFHAMTLDRRDYRPGGGILIAVLEEDAGKISKKYGLNWQGRNVSKVLTGTLVAASGKGPDQNGRGVWLVDTTGKAADLIKDKKIGGLEGGGGDGPGMNGEGRPFGPRRHGPGPN